MQTLEQILEEIDSEIEKAKNTDGSLVGTSMWNQWVRGMERAKDVIRKHMNDGWIPVDERLPEDENIYLVTCRTKKGVLNINRAYCIDGIWHGSGTMSKVIAWQPLPEPYNPEKKNENGCKNEEFTGWKAKMLKTFCKCE